jgi:hypothetical protein
VNEAAENDDVDTTKESAEGKNQSVTVDNMELASEETQNIEPSAGSIDESMDVQPVGTDTVPPIGGQWEKRLWAGEGLIVNRALVV